MISEIFENRPSISAKNPFSVLFVCLGNICRSPTGEGIFISKVDSRNLKAFFEIDSCGTAGYHIGEPAHATSQSVANNHGVYLPSLGRQLSGTDFEKFDLILAMDTSNLSDIHRIQPKDSKALVTLMRTFDPQRDSDSVPDPYYGGLNGFENVFQVLERSCENLLDELEKFVEK